MIRRGHESTCDCPFGDFGRHRYDCASLGPAGRDGFDRACGDPGKRRDAAFGKASWLTADADAVLDLDPDGDRP